MRRDKYRDYIERGSWRCPESPHTPPSHHWVIGNSRNGNSRGVCKFCLQTREFVTVGDGYSREAVALEPGEPTIW